MEITVLLHTGETLSDEIVGDIRELTYDDILSAFHKSPEEWVFVRDGGFVDTMGDRVVGDNDITSPVRVCVIDLSFVRGSSISTISTISAIPDSVSSLLSGLSGILPQPTPAQTTTTPRSRYMDILQSMVREYTTQPNDRNEISLVSDDTYASGIATLRDMGFTHSEPVMRRYIRLYHGDVELVANFFLNSE